MSETNRVDPSYVRHSDNDPMPCKENVIAFNTLCDQIHKLQYEGDYRSGETKALRHYQVDLWATDRQCLLTNEHCGSGWICTTPQSFIFVLRENGTHMVNFNREEEDILERLESIRRNFSDIIKVYLWFHSDMALWDATACTDQHIADIIEDCKIWDR